MRIVILSFYSGWIERGVENYVSELAPRLNKHHKVMVLQAGPVVGREKWRRRLGGRMKWPPDPTLTWMRKFYVDYYSRKIAEFSLKSIPEIKSFNPDIIYPLNGGWMSLVGKLFSKFYGAKLILGGHAGIGRDDRFNLILRPDLFLAFSQKGYKWAKKVAPEVKSSKVSHGVNLKRFNPNVKPAKVHLHRPLFVIASRLIPYKRVGETVMAVGRLVKGSILVLGDGPEAKKIDRLGKKLLGPKRYHRLSVSHNVISQYYQAADVFTLASSTSEAFGLAYLEALASGLPVVTTDDPLRREIVGSAGVFVKNPLDLAEYSQALQLAIDTKWADKPRKQAEKFSWDKATRKYHQLFKSLVVSSTKT